MCKQCETKPVYEFTNQRKLCKNCFIKYFQKKVLYTIRKFKMIKRDDVIGYENNKGFRGVVLEDVLKMFSKKAMVELVKMPTKKKVNKIAVASTIDLESNEIVNEIIKGNLKKFKKIKPVEGKSIKPLYLFLDKEVSLYANLKDLKFIKKKQKKDKILEFVDELEKKHPEIKRAVVNSYLKICD